MPIDARMRAQINLILDSFPDAAAHPEISLWDNLDVDDVEYIYRKQTILVRDQDAARVADAIDAILEREGYREPPEGDQPSEGDQRSEGDQPSEGNQRSEGRRRRRYGQDRVRATRRVVT